MTTVYHYHTTYGIAPAALPPFHDDGGNHFALYFSFQRIFSGKRFPNHLASPPEPPSLSVIVLPWCCLCYSVEGVAAAQSLFSEMGLSLPPELVLSIGGTVSSTAVRAITSFHPYPAPRILPLYLQITAESSSSSPYADVELTYPLTWKTSCGGDFDVVNKANDHLHQSSSIGADLDHDHVSDGNGSEAFRSVSSSTSCELAPCNDQIGQNESTVAAASGTSTELIPNSEEPESESEGGEEESTVDFYRAPTAEPDAGRKSKTSDMSTESKPNSEEPKSESGGGGGGGESTVDFDRAPTAEPEKSKTSDMSTESIPNSEEQESESGGGGREEGESTVDFDLAPAAEPDRRLVEWIFPSLRRLRPLDDQVPAAEPDWRRRLVREQPSLISLFSLAAETDSRSSLVEETSFIRLPRRPSFDFRRINVYEDADHDDDDNDDDDDDDDHDDDNGHDHDYEVVNVVDDDDDDGDDDDTGDDVFEDDWETDDDELTAAPASKSAIRALEALDTDALAGVHNWCTVCQEDFAVPRGLPDGEDVIDDDLGVVRMPCGHVYHRGCIVTWLETSHSCPICRFALPTSAST